MKTKFTTQTNYILPEVKHPELEFISAAGMTTLLARLTTEPHFPMNSTYKKENVKSVDNTKIMHKPVYKQVG